MNSTMKTILPIGLVVALVFGVTFLSQFTNTPKPVANDPNGASSDLGPPLHVPYSLVYYNPDSVAEPNIVNQYYPGFYELHTEGNWVAFPVGNRRAHELKIVAVKRSCSKCTGARAAAIPTEDFQAQLRTIATGTMPSISPVPDILSGIAYVAMRSKLQWQTFDFDHPEKTFAIPAATSPGATSMALIELGFEIKAIGEPTPVVVHFDVLNEKNERMITEPLPFAVKFAGREPFEVYPRDMEAGEFPDGTNVRTHDLLVYSIVRDFDAFPPPQIVVGGNDPYVTSDKAVALTDVELDKLAFNLSNTFKYPVRIRSGYRIPINIHREAGGKSLDIGPFEKEIHVGSSQGGKDKTYRVGIKGTIYGAIRLESDNKINFERYDSDAGKKLKPRLWTERTELELEVVPELCDPKFLKVELSASEIVLNRKYWTLNVQILPKEGRRPPWDGIVYLRTKGPNPINVRIPVSGHGR